MSKVRFEGRIIPEVVNVTIKNHPALRWKDGRAEAAPAAVPPAPDANDLDRRIDEIAARANAKPRRQPRIRGLW